MKHVLSLFFFLGFLPSAGAQPVLISESSSGPQFIRYLLDSQALGDNQIGSPSRGSVQVVLPPDYATSGVRYPVVYYLHGHGGNPQEVRAWLSVLNQGFKDKKGFILVGLEGKNTKNGGFWVNSPVTGRFEDWLIKEVIPFIDATLRTLPKREARGLFGFSMGGFGALYHGLKHPEVFSAVFAMGPGVISPEEDLPGVYDTWDGAEDFLSGYAGAFAGRLEAQPAFDGSPQDQALIELWTSGFGQWDKKADGYLAQPLRLKALALEWGDRDSYEWITNGSRWLAKYLPSRGIPVQAFEFKGGHQIPPDRRVNSVVPFFLTHLVKE